MSVASIDADDIRSADHEVKIEYICDITARLFSSKRESFIRVSVADLLRS